MKRARKPIRIDSVAFRDLPLEEQYLILRTADGYVSERIAKDLGLTTREYDEQLSGICERLGIGSASQMLMWVLSQPDAARWLQELRVRGYVSLRPQPRLKPLVLAHSAVSN